MCPIPLSTGTNSIATLKKAHGREYRRTVEFDLITLAATPRSWISVALQHMEERSHLTPFNPSDIERFRRLLWKVAERSDLKRILLTETKFIGRKETQILFAGMEDCIDLEFTWTVAIKARASMDFRRLMEEFVPPEYFAEPLQRSFAFFRTRFSFSYVPRPIIGEQHRDTSLSDHPIDALPHQNVSDLKEKIKARLDAPATKLIDACVAELEYWGEVRETLYGLHPFY